MMFQMYVCAYIQMYVCAYIQIYVCAYIQMYVCAYIHPEILKSQCPSTHCVCVYTDKAIV